jgi:hypothetical protein
MKKDNSGFMLLITLMLGVLIIGLLMTMKSFAPGADGKTKTERDIGAIKEAEAVKIMLEKRDAETNEY